MKCALRWNATDRQPFWCGLLTLLCCSNAFAADQPGASRVTFHGYDDCLRLENTTIRVTLCPRAGGRVLEYSWKGVNALYLPTGDEGWEYQTEKDWGTMNAGRFDIGPEQTIAPHPVLWAGRWEGEVIGPRSARLTSHEVRTLVSPLRGLRTLDQGGL